VPLDFLAGTHARALECVIGTGPLSPAVSAHVSDTASDRGRSLGCHDF